MIKNENILVPLSHYRKWLIPFQDDKTRKFIKKAKLVHTGEGLDYSKVKYINGITKVCIVCSKHGEFWQKPEYHLRGDKCAKCSLENRAERMKGTNESFIMRANIIFKGFYDYSKTDYKSIQERVCIICPKHGEFWQTPASHLSGSGCPVCGKERAIEALSSNTEEFILKSQKIHGELYEYSKVNYTGSSNKVCIICPEHGEFWQDPEKHLKGCGCPICGEKRSQEAFNKYRESNRGNTDSFIEKSKKVHGDLYDYSKVNYINHKTNVCIICPKHGEFWQRPSHHLEGCRCPKCVIEDKIKSQTLGTELFIKKSQQIHGSKYDYSKVDYISSKTPVTIICPIHGEFLQKPQVHLSGSGCPTCGYLNICESYVGDWLNENNINNTKYFTTELIKISGHIIIDYKAIIDDIEVWIEYNGQAHYEFIDYFHKGNIETFKDQLRRDEKVRNYCNKNNIRLIEIPYTYNTKESIFEFLDKVITKGIDPYTFIDYESLYKRPLDYESIIEN